MADETITPEEAQLVIEEDRNARALACLAEVMRVAKERYGCRLEAVAYVTAEGRVLAQFQAVAL